LVLLLGCSAGSGRVLQADEPASLAETFLHIGASSVIAPMWDTDISATSQWAQAFAHSWVGTERPTALAAMDASRALSDDGYGIERFGALTVRGDWI
jgi:CHAT domain-containing protein